MTIDPGARGVSFDGDADRIVYFFYKEGRLCLSWKIKMQKTLLTSDRQGPSKSVRGNQNQSYVVNI